ncbi:hypothetical protein BXY66_2935 [Shimia isoporae]|uniref:Lipoprotein n=1 Tax=Shimia isoporae TaxID=647720 RepID=A0A4R1NBV7_9RHOB|nr:hypothetical protein [Shimia isoporae]TCL01619.1 hypothetical protein BXY66_2935 [Shimia isoporae]
MKLGLGIAVAASLSGCASYHAARSDYEDAISSPEFRAVKEACASGSVAACQTVVEARAARQQSSNYSYSADSSYRANRNRDLIMQHGAGGCTPNFATGGCL